MAEDRLEVLRKLSESELKEIVSINDGARVRNSNTRTLFAATLAGAFIGTTAIEIIARKIGYPEVASYIQNTGFGLYIIPTVSACIGKTIYDFTGWRGRQLDEYNCAKKVLSERKELTKLKSVYEKTTA